MPPARAGCSLDFTTNLWVRRSVFALVLSRFLLIMIFSPVNLADGSPVQTLRDTEQCYVGVRLPALQVRQENPKVEIEYVTLSRSALVAGLITSGS